MICKVQSKYCFNQKLAHNINTLIKILRMADLATLKNCTISRPRLYSSEIMKTDTYKCLYNAMVPVTALLKDYGEYQGFMG